MSIILSNLKTDCFSNVNLKVEKNEKIAIVGENGVGKTTLLRTILGLTSFKGDIEILDKKLQSKNDFKQIYQEIGYLFQDSDDSFIASSVLEEVAFNLYNKTEDYNFSKKETLFLLEEFGISKLKDKIPMRLSGGQKRIVAFCSCLISKPKILLLDEPTNHLDKNLKVKVENKIKEYEGNVIFIAHDIEFAKKVSDKIYKLTKDGLVSYK